MLGKTRNEMTGIETVVQHIVEKKQSLGHIVRECRFNQLEIVICIEHIQHSDGLLVSDVIAAKRHQLVKNRQRVAHTSVGFLRHHIECLFTRRNTLVGRYFLQVRDGIRYRDSIEVIHLATAENGRQHLVLLRRRKDENSIGRRFFQRL